MKHLTLNDRFFRSEEKETVLFVVRYCPPGPYPEFLPDFSDFLFPHYHLSDVTLYCYFSAIMLILFSFFLQMI